MGAGKDKFVLIELVDPKVVRVLERLRDLLGKRHRRTGVHITVRGPYGREPRKLFLKRMEEKIQGEPLLISGAGRFQNGNVHVVYLKVSSRFLKAVWWKPDFPVRGFGFNPHISIYEGEDAEAADVVLRFLKREHIELLCFDYSVRLHDRNKPFVVVHAPRNGGDAGTERVKWGRVVPGLLRRAAEVGKSVHLTPRQQRLF